MSKLLHWGDIGEFITSLVVVEVGFIIPRIEDSHTPNLLVDGVHEFFQSLKVKFELLY